MYIRANQHARSDADVIEVIERNMFATLVTGLIASHLPFLLEDGVLYAHMARANPHGAVVGTGESLVIFTGPHAYVSPSWYAERGPVPTWAYVAVHCYGTAVVHDRDGTERNIARLVERMEDGRPNRWSMADLDPAEKDELIANVVSFEIPVTRMEARFKLNQRDHPERIAALIAELERGGDAGLASYVRRYNGG